MIQPPRTDAGSGDRLGGENDAPDLPSDARRSLFVYNLLFPIVFALMLPSLLLRLVRRGGYREKFGQRFARYSSADLERFRSRKWIWIHSISVGETFVALKLARALHEEWPECGVLLSTTTSTGFAEARKAACEWLEPIYNPIDTRSIVGAALSALRPRRLILIEGEAWPNLVGECAKRGIPVSLANARLSPRSERRLRACRRWTGPIFRLLDRITVSDPGDLARWESLGVKAERIVCTGNIKFDLPGPAASRASEFRELLTALSVPPNAPILLGGSTWAPEEKALAETLGDLRSKYPDLFLILVPRHVERLPEILRELSAFPFSVARRSQLGATGTSRADILIVDVTGELRDWYALATVVFVGKSLPGIPQVGGQNPGEPALLEKPVVFGPHMENFATLVAQLTAADAVRQISSADELAPCLAQLFEAPILRAELGSRSRAIVSAHTGATARTAKILLA
jgi:3-deoxy-D-manno-octulosonic-acid transferase